MAADLIGHSRVGQCKTPGPAIPSRVEELQHSTGLLRSQNRGASREQAPRLWARRRSIPKCGWMAAWRTRRSRARLSPSMSPVVRHHEWGGWCATNSSRTRPAPPPPQRARRGSGRRRGSSSILTSPRSPTLAATPLGSRARTTEKGTWSWVKLHDTVPAQPHRLLPCMYMWTDEVGCSTL